MAKGAGKKKTPEELKKEAAALAASGKGAKKGGKPQKGVNPFAKKK